MSELLGLILPLGVGKTSLIKAIVQSCEHIVHVDPINSAATAASTIRARPRRQSFQVDHGTAQITEIYASTKPYPEWWSDLDDMQLLRRRKSLGDTVLDRNLCFVDTPGLNRTPSVRKTALSATVEKLTVDAGRRSDRKNHQLCSFSSGSRLF
jgi:hypothetical protein